MLMLLLSLHAGGGPTPVPPRVPLHYKIVAKQAMDIDLTAVGQPVMNVVMTSLAYVSVTISDTTGGKLVHVVVDSSSFDAGALGASLPAEYTASPTGAVYHIYLVNGVPVSQPGPMPASIQAGQLVPGVELLLAGMHPSGASGSWVDTATASDAGTTTTRITSWTAKPGAGGRTQADGTWKGNAAVGSGMQKMELALAGTAHLTAMPGALSETASSTGTGQANMNIGGNSIPMKVTLEVTAAAMP